MNNFRLIALMVLLVLGLDAGATGYFDYNAQCRAAYQSFLSLKIDEGKALIDKELKENPDNLTAVFLSNYGDVLPLLFNGSPEEYKKARPNFSRRLQQIERGDATSPWYLFCKSAIYFQLAAVRLRFGENLSGGRDLRKSFLLIRENDQKFPNFQYNKIYYGLEEAMIGTIPDNYKWVASILGMRGNLKDGIQKITDFVRNQHSEATEMREEAIFYYSFLRFYLFQDQQEVIRTLKSFRLDTRNNLSYAFMMAHMALDDHRADDCITILENRNKGPEYLPVALFDFQMGTALLQKNDPGCVRYLQKFLNESQGSFYLKSAYQKLSYYYWINGNSSKATYYKQKILNAGSSEIDMDKQAQRFARTNGFPNPLLLKAQLHSAGGFFNNALAALEQVKPGNLSHIDEMIEYYYRCGEVHRLLGNQKRAVNYYLNALNLGTDSRAQYAARSALELGLMYEAMAQKAKALEYFKKCLSLKNHDFQSSIDQKAKAGISRLQ